MKKLIFLLTFIPLNAFALITSESIYDTNNIVNSGKNYSNSKIFNMDNVSNDAINNIVSDIKNGKNKKNDNSSLTSKPIEKPKEKVVKYLNPNCREENKGFWNNKQGRGWFWKQDDCVPIEEPIEPSVEDDIQTQIKDNEQQQIIVNIFPGKDDKKDNKTKTAQKNRMKTIIDENGREWEAIPEKQQIPWDIINKINPKQVADIIEPEARSVMLMYPTDENIYEYRKLSLWMLVKSSNMAKADIKVRTNNPELIDANSPVNSQFKTTASIELNQARVEQAIEKHKDNMVLLMFYSNSCKFCHNQINVLRMLLEETGMRIEAKEISEEPKIVENFKVEQVPDMFIVYNSPNGVKYQRIATGLTDKESLKTAIVRGLYYLGVKDISEDYIYD